MMEWPAYVLGAVVAAALAVNVGMLLMVSTQISGMKTELSELSEMQRGMQTELSGMQTELSGMQTELSGMKTQLSELSGMQRGMNSELTKADIAATTAINIAVRVTVKPGSERGNAMGSGCLIRDPSTRWTYLLTARHVLEDSSPDGFERDIVNLELFGSSMTLTPTGKVKFLLHETEDIAIVRVPSADDVDMYIPWIVAEKPRLFTELYGASYREQGLVALRGIVMEHPKDATWRVQADTQGTHGFSGACLLTAAAEGPAVAALHVSQGQFRHTAAPYSASMDAAADFMDSAVRLIQMHSRNPRSDLVVAALAGDLVAAQ